MERETLAERRMPMPVEVAFHVYTSSNSYGKCVENLHGRIQPFYHWTITVPRLIKLGDFALEAQQGYLRENCRR